jgi:DAK2 domain fusion protein YloV
MNYYKLNGEHFYNMMVNASNKLEEQKEFVNSLNVFPVPDGDTGTNMSMTFRAAVEEIKGFQSKSIGEVSKKLAKGALMGARGNSGVILSQILRGIAKGLENKDEVDVKEFAESLAEGSKAAYKAVMRPTEGTILTIIRAAGEAAVSSTSDSFIALMEEVCDHSRNMLNKTPEMLPVLKKAKVVDAGGMGLLVILNGILEGLKAGLENKLELSEPVKANNAAAQALKDEEITFGYCTEFLILAEGKDENSFREDIEKHGDSIIVVGYEDVIKVHIHTNDPGLVLSKAVKLGELSKIKIENMREQHRHLLTDENTFDQEEVSQEIEEKEEKEYGMISVAMGEGITNIFKDLCVDYVIEGGQTMNPSTQDMLDRIDKINAKNIFIFPNNKNIIMAASQAAELSEKNIIVIPTKTIPQGITAITMFNSEASVQDNENDMLEAIENVTSASVTYAVRDTEMDGQEIKEGNILGLLEGKIKEVGTDPYDVCNKLVDAMTDEDSELITVFYGQDCNEEKVKEMMSVIEERYSSIDVQCYKGDQPLYYFILAVE